EHDDHFIDIEFPSDTSKDYHPLVGDEKYNPQRVDHLDDTQNTRTWLYQLDNNEEVSYCDIIKQLRFFQAVSFKLEPKSLSDLRLLAYFLPLFSQYNAQLFSISYLISSFLDKFIQSGSDMLYRVQVRALCRPVLKAPDLVGFLPPLCIATSCGS
ncbi:hypothetical protein CU097_003806, partial [Rhizopus azygosporus]